MKKLKKFLFAAFTVAILSCLLCQPAFAAISESDVQAQVDAVGKEAVSGNVFIWFLCAIGFLKVGQKIDSFLSSLGVNVGHTGGSMLAEAMIAARGIGGIKNFSSHHFGGGRNSSSTNVNANGGKGSGGFGAGFASGGLAGVVSRKVTNSAIKTATTTPGSKPSGLGSLLGDAAAGGIGGHMYASSVSKGGNFANNVIGSVATGSISQMGSISGEKAAEALHSYMGYAALESGAENVPTFQNIEIGGGRITGTELTAEHPEGISFGMYHADQSGAGAAGVRLAGDFLLEIAKTIRGYGGASIFASQDLADFFDLDGGRFGKGIINNSKTKIILNLEDDEAQRVQEALHLSDAETMEITHFERGHGLISTNNNNIMVEFKASPLEKDLITTDRRELREIVERKRREQSTSAEQQI